MKDYKKIYKRFVKEIEHELEAHRKQDSDSPYERQQLLDAIETRYAISVLETVLAWTRELEGKEPLGMLMNQKSFNRWKKSIRSQK